MKIAINGISGFVGSYLSEFFKSKNYSIVPIYKEQGYDLDKLNSLLEGCDVVINLAGANISKKWTDDYKKELVQSRIETTKNLVDTINKMQNPPELFISTSAVGIYEHNKKHSEESKSFDKNFLGELALKWEDEAQKIDNSKTRVCITRFGVVLGNGGAISQMLPIFKLGFGGILGNGKQAFSWIHIQDLVRAYDFIIQNKMSGTFNFTSPNPISNYIFTKVLGKILCRPTIFAVPAFALKLKFGEGATILLDGQEVYPVKLLKSGFEFKFESIDLALKDILKQMA